MTDNILNLNKILGLAIAGDDHYVNSAYVSLFSFLRYNSDKIDEIWIVTTHKSNKFDKLKNFININYSIELKIIIENNIEKYKDLGSYNNNFFCHLKFSLFSKIKKDDFLIYLDTDTLVISEINIAQICKSIIKNKVTIAAVPAQRAVLDRFSHLNLNNPYDYFNTGVLFIFFDEKYKLTNLLEHNKEMLNITLEKNYWGDQCLLNHIFNNKYLKLPPIYNVHNGYISNEYSSVLNINSLLESYIFNHSLIIHFSDGNLNKTNFHPYKYIYNKEIEYLKKLFINSNITNFIDYKYINFHNSKIDFFLQLIYLKKRKYTNIYYPSLKKTIKKFIVKFLNK